MTVESIFMSAYLSHVSVVFPVFKSGHTVQHWECRAKTTKCACDCKANSENKHEG